LRTGSEANYGHKMLLNCKVLELVISAMTWQTSPPVSGVVRTK
jgi:hypothetical protein